MSYSFNVKAANKELAKAAVAAEFSKIVVSQLAHERDRSAVLSNANAIINLLADDFSKDISVSVNGYVSWPNPANEAPKFNSVAINCQASHVARTET